MTTTTTPCRPPRCRDMNIDLGWPTSILIGFAAATVLFQLAVGLGALLAWLF